MEASIPPYETPTRFDIAYPATFALWEGHELATGLSTVIKVSFEKTFTGDEEFFREWLRTNDVSVVRDEILPRLNNFLLAIKATQPDLFLTSTLRNIGELDLVFVNLYLNDEIVMSRASVTMVGPGPDSLDMPDPDALSKPVSVVRSRLLRAVDLVHHGYPSEAVLVAFALLDLQTQDFLVDRLPNLNTDAGRALLDRIERQRLKTYLGPLMRMCVGVTPLDDQALAYGLTEVNRLRNDAIHRAHEISTYDAQEALQTIHRLLKFMDEHGAGFGLPGQLAFWTP